MHASLTRAVRTGRKRGLVLLAAFGVTLGLIVGSASAAGAVNGYQQLGLFERSCPSGSMCIGGAGEGQVTLPMTCRQDNHRYTLSVNLRVPDKYLASGMFFKAAVYYRDITFTANPAWLTWVSIPSSYTKVTASHYINNLAADYSWNWGSFTGLSSHRYEMVVSFQYAAPGGTWSTSQYVASSTAQVDYRGVSVGSSGRTCFT